MKDNNIEELLREAKPVVKDDPAFLMETRRRMEQVEGIKKEVDRQHKNSRIILIVTLAAGLVLGMLAMAVVFLFPEQVQGFQNGFLANVRNFLESYKQYLFFGVAALAIALGITLGTGRRNSIFSA
ncbi:MAG: hypothetical protein IK119_08150 [Bacteroidales bacterium]|nr:hypothetical protein [Bacteroidales bacterium]MBR5432332.1 hypothetical protein [Bacteroidales bacterium]